MLLKETACAEILCESAELQADAEWSRQGGCCVVPPNYKRMLSGPAKSTRGCCVVPHFEKHDKDDDGYLSKSDLENMTGVWGDVLIDRQATDDEDERPKKQIKLKESASAEAVHIFHASSKQWNTVC